MNVTLDLYPHPVTAEGRATRQITCPDGATAEDVLDTLGLDAGALEVRVDGVPLPVPARAGRVLREGAVVHLRPTLAGGDDTDPLRTVLQIALIATVAWAGGPLAAAGFGKGAVAAIQAGAFVVGGLVINAIAPPRLPELPGGAGAVAGEPQYSLTLGRNQARRYGPAPLVLGLHRVLPDLASQQWTEFENDDQYLSATFNFGIGDLSITELQIGSTALTDYQDVNHWLSIPALADGWNPDPVTGAGPKVAGNVDVEAGGVIESTADWVTRLAPGAQEVGLDFVGRLFTVSADGNYADRRINITIELSPKIAPTTEGGAPTWGTAITHAVQLRHGLPSPKRFTWCYIFSDVQRASAADGEWRVRVRRAAGSPLTTDAARQAAQAAGNAVHYDDVTWQTLRTYQADTGDYRGHTRLAVRIRASGQLSGALDSVSALVQQKVPVPAGDSAWSAPAATSNPAWIFRAVALGWRHPDGHLLAGAGLPAERLDDASIRRWGAWCITEGLRCDYVVQQPMSVQALLELIAQCGRASPTWASGQLGVIYEDADAAPTALVSPGSIVAGSFGIDYPAGQVVDEVVCSYIDPALDWQVSEVRRTRPGITTPATSTSITLRGVTTRAQAAMEANLAAARQTYHRRRLAWEMGPGALTALARGDVVHITHSLIDSGETGRLAGLDGPRLDLGRTVTLPVGTHLLLLELPDGRLHTAEISQPDTSTAAADVAQVTLSAAPPRPEDEDAPGWIAADVRWRLYADDAPPLQARITSVEPNADGTARFSAIDEVAAYHAAARTNTEVDPPTLHGAPPRVVAIWPWTESLESDAGHTVEVHILIDTTGEWRGGDVHVSGDVDWEGRIERGALTTGWSVPRTGTLTVTVTPDGNPGGEFTVSDYAIDGPPSIPVPRWRGPWEAGQHYSVSDMVAYSGRSYLAVEATLSSVANRPTGTSVNNDWWELFADVGATGARGPTGATGATGNDGGRGADGRRYEWCYCRTARSTTSIPSTSRPLDTWGYDKLRNGAITVGGVAWYDGSPPPTSSKPKVWWCARLVPAGVRNDQTTGLGDWSAPHPLVEDGVDGRQGLRGGDGNGYEHVYARTVYSKTSFTTAQKPPRPTDSAPWGFDYLSRFPNGVNRGGVRWYDGSPPQTSGRSKLWWCVRHVDGTPALNARVTSPWSEPKELVEDGADGAGITYSNSCWIAGTNLKICGATNLSSGRNQTFSFAGGFSSNPLILVTPHSNFAWNYQAREGPSEGPYWVDRRIERVPYMDRLSRTGFRITSDPGPVAGTFIRNVSTSRGSVTFDYIAIGLPPSG